jgi:phosphatidylglycerol---prolipoprotein diacylglyceryl transferase
LPVPSITLGPLTLRTFTACLMLAVAFSAGIGLYRQRAQGRAGAVADAYLGAIIGGVILARLFHVLLNWNTFSENLNEVFRLSSGGLDWHGAVIGGLIGLGLVARWRGLNSAELRESLTLALPLLALAGWAGCWASSCGYGKEVDTLAHYPAFAVAESPDVYGIIAPRYNTQFFGMALAVVTLLLAGVMTWRVPNLRPKLRLDMGRLAGRQFWLTLGVLSMGMFFLGFLRADSVPIIAGLRADQWLDGLLVAVSIPRSAVSKENAED